MVAGLALKLVMVGAAGVTVTTAVEVALGPPGPLTVSVYVVVAVGLTEVATPLETAILPGVMTPVPFEKTAVRLELLPAVIDAGLAAKLVIAGGLVLPPPPPLLPPQPASVTIPSEKTAATAAKTRLCIMASSKLLLNRFRRGPTVSREWPV